MGKKLIITEKPSVAQDFAKVFGVSGRKNGYIENGEYVITWCVGHLVEMVYPENYDIKYKKWKLEDLPFLPEEYKYDVIDSVRQQYEIVHNMLWREDIDTVYWAGDSGKEGQTIEENIRNYGGVRENMTELRVWIDSQTEEEIRRGVTEAKPMSAYANLGRSGIMRTIEDYAMGINFSRAMTVKYGRLLNDAAGTDSYTAIAVGRVMTCVLGMVVIREREIRNFKETPFYRVIGSFTEAQIEGEWKAVEGSAYFESPLLYKENGFKKQEDAQELIETLNGQEAVVEAIERGTTKKRAPLLFNLAELQAECAKRFKISPDETLQVAQDLYEKKLTTYPRTDARVLSTAVVKEISKNLNRLKSYEPTTAYVEHILREGSYRTIAKTQYTDDSKVTDHYAIIPTGQITELKSLNDLQRKIYDLIVRRFLSIFYPAAVYRTVKLTVQMDKERFFASAKALKEPGYLEIAGKEREEDKEKEEQESPGLLGVAETLQKGDVLTVNELSIKEGKTSPPKRYTSGSMVLAMENAGQLIEDEELRAQIKGSGIGTSATRAEIIKKLVRIGYLNLNKKTQVLTPERIGEMIYEVVDMTVPALLNPKMTASWEKGLDGITQGTVEFSDYRKKLEDFIRKETLAIAGGNITEPLVQKIRPFAGKNARGAAAKKSLPVACPLCGGDIETTPFGYGCSNYKRDGSGCKFAIGTIAGKDLEEEDVIALLKEGHTKVLKGFVSKKKKKFSARLVLSETEDGKKQINFDFSENEPETVEGVKCPICGGAIQVTAFGYGCANYAPDSPESCSFSIGKIAGKDLSAAQMKELLTNGQTGTIRGFTSKAKKKFDACLVLKKNEAGVPQIQFDFENVEAKKLKNVVCPLCGGAVVVTPFGYACENYKREAEDGCTFAIGKIASVKLKEAQVKELLTRGKTDVIEGFVAKTGMKFHAPLKLTEDGRVAFDFPEKQPPEDTNVNCPKCGIPLKRSQWYYECSCGYRLRYHVAQVTLSEETIAELLTTGKTKHKITGFVSKAGKQFDTCLKYENDNIAFDFDNPGEPVQPQMEEKKEGEQKEDGTM